MNRTTKEYEETRAFFRTVMAFILFTRFGGDSAWKDPLTVDKAYEQADQFVAKLESDFAKCKQQ